MRGRKPKPTKLRLLHGNPGRRPINGDEPQPKPGLPRPPANLRRDRIALREYRRKGRELVALGLMTCADDVALAAYATAFSRWVRASDGIEEHGLMVQGRMAGEPVRSPYLAIVNQAIEQMKFFLSEFGMTPSSRSRLHVELPQTDNPFEAYLRRGRSPTQTS